MRYRETGRYQALLPYYQMHINSYLFSDHGSDEEERWSHIRRTSSDAERRRAGKDLPFSYYTLSSCHQLINQEKHVYSEREGLATTASSR